MKISFDQEGDLLCAEWGNTEGATAREVEKGIYLLYQDGEPVALEVLFLHRRRAFKEGLSVEIPQPAGVG